MIAGPLSPEGMARSGLDGLGGVELIGVWPGSAGGKMGLERGDVILTVNGGTIESLDDLRNEIGLAGTGGQVELTVVRDGQERTMMGMLAPWPAGKRRIDPDGATEERFRAWQQRRLDDMEKTLRAMRRQVEDLERGEQPVPPPGTPLLQWPAGDAFARLPAWRLRVHCAIRRGADHTSPAEVAWDARVLLGTPPPPIY